ncbi:GNAT family N-acetyltransferase [Anaerocolumna sp. AGMB13025]|uniref:GNAT family N-acetyltransferase n=1 Tax=Anaerocolumna sp. AGMB13025 TaxID=3039116 RepID=UPI00241D46CB|nr:GNAT family N-acetyltransferase [Anaerocolumna sp. AGMB13025]WFR55528.1 GNAT family N-acetyltransferase [Anaerocolumna sp. AGMB13025]
MIIISKDFNSEGFSYCIRSAKESDARELSELRVQIDGETENLDRESGEGFIDEAGFGQLIVEDSNSLKNLFLVAETQGKIVGFSRCEGSVLKRLSHKVEFGICILLAYQGYGIGKHLLSETVSWADSNDIEKISLLVLETNERAIRLYQKHGFEIEGILRKDKRLSDGNFYNTIVMGRLKEQTKI